MQKYQYEYLYKYASNELKHIHQVTHIDSGIVCTIFKNKLINIKYTLNSDGSVSKQRI